MFKIGEFSKLSNTTVRTLRHYEKMELLSPATIDQNSGYRYYEAEQLSVINQIKLLQQTGLSLESIKDILSQNKIELLNYYYELKENELSNEMEELKKKQKMISLLKEKLKEGINMEKYNVVVKTIPARKVIGVKKIIDNFQLEGELWQELSQKMAAHQIKPAADPLVMTIFHDKEYKEKDVEVEVQLQIEESVEKNDELNVYEAPEWQIASVTFSGSFDQMPLVTQAIGSWLESNHYTISGPMVNISHVSPGDDPNPENWVTEAAFVISKI